MPNVDVIFTMLRNDLSAPRTLLAQVINYISDRYGYAATELDRFFTEKYPTLEDYEVDLAFSPQYTPAEHNRLEYIPVLGGGHLSPSAIALLKRRLADEKLEAVFSPPDNTEIRIYAPVHETFIERYVNLLGLDQRLPEVLYTEILASVPTDSHHEVNLLGREEVWRSEHRQWLLIGFLRTLRTNNRFSTLKISFLTNFMRTYRPTGLPDLLRQLESLIESCQVDMENVEGRGFHDEYLKALNVGNVLTRSSEQDIWAHYRHMMDLAAQLKEDALQIDEAAPDIAEKLRSAIPL